MDTPESAGEVTLEDQDNLYACVANRLGLATSPDATAEEIQALLDDRTSLGRRDFGRLVCEVGGCDVACNIRVRDDGVPVPKRMNQYWLLLDGCKFVTYEEDNE